MTVQKSLENLWQNQFQNHEQEKAYENYTKKRINPVLRKTPIYSTKIISQSGVRQYADFHKLYRTLIVFKGKY